MSNQPDAYNNVGDVSPHNDQIVGSDGIPLPRRRIIRLGSSISATDQPNSDATLIQAVAGTGDLLAANNLSDVANAAASRVNLGLPTTVTDASFTGATSLPFTWTADAFRRLEIHLRIVTGPTGAIKFVFTGPAPTGQYYTRGALNVGGTSWTADTVDAANFFQLSGFAPFQLDAMAQIKQDGAARSIIINTCEPAAATQGRYSGTCFETATGISGISFTFASATDGWMTILGYP